MNKYLGKIGLVIVAVIWGSGFVASALALEHYSPYQILALRFTLAFVVWLLINIRKLKKFSFTTMWRGSLLGVFLFLAFAFQTVGLQYTTPSKNAFLTAVNVVIVPFLGYLIFKKKLPVKNIIGSFITLIGIAMLSLTQAVGSVNFGDVLTLICAVFFALQIFSTDYFVKEEETWALMLLQMGVAAVLSWLTLFATKGDVPTLQVTTMMPVLYLGLVSTLLAYFIQTISQKKTTSSEAAIILSTEAFFGMISSVIILNEHISINMLFGAILIFVGILVVELEIKGWSTQRS
ncbi:DMT family transporter [Enterococcus sp.]|uniref:DMT family transporter n=1 Tax=Enterococcus sp. TaxID=35783 RepID=UPI002FC85290